MGLLDAIYSAVWIAGAIFILSFLDTYPMPHFADSSGLYDLGLKDVKFYCPPHVAIALGFFNVKTIPALYTTFAGILVAVSVAIAVVEFGEQHIEGVGRQLTELGLPGQPVYILRVAVVGAATFAMKLGGAYFPPAGAVAVLFVDNPGLKGIGRPYLLTPGLSGTIILFIMAAIKITLGKAFGGKEKLKTN